MAALVIRLKFKSTVIAATAAHLAPWLANRVPLSRVRTRNTSVCTGDILLLPVFIVENILLHQLLIVNFASRSGSHLIGEAGQRVKEGFGIVDSWTIIEKEPNDDRMIAVEVKGLLLTEPGQIPVLK